MVQVGAGAVILDAGRDLRLDKTTTRPWDRIATFSRSDRVTAPQSAEENTPVNGSWPLLVLVAKSIFTLAIERIQAQNEHHF